MADKKRSPVKPQSKKGEPSRLVRFIWMIVVGPIALLFLIIFFTSIGLFGSLPTIEDLANPRSNLASEIISSDQEILGKFYVENRSSVRYSELSPTLVNALVSTEDSRFYEHSGIDFRALFRVLVRTVIGGDSGSGGGSTITQQLAKNMFPREDLNKISLHSILMHF